MKHLVNHLVQRHLVPVLLLPVVLSGLFCFAIFGLPAAVRSSSREEEVILVVVTLLVVLGSSCMCVWFSAVSVASARSFVCGSSAVSFQHGECSTWDARPGPCSLLLPGWLASGADF